MCPRIRMAFISKSPIIAGGRQNEVCKAPPRGHPVPDGMCDEMRELNLEAYVARTRLSQIVAKRFSTDQRSPFSAKLKTLPPPMIRWSLTFTSISARQSRSLLVINSSAWLTSQTIEG